jgi:hypothetical protein
VSEMSPSVSPTVRRRRLAAELRRLRGDRTANEVAQAISWSATKISRAESDRENIPRPEVRKLLDYYQVADPLRSRLLELAEGATQRGWWEDYADVLNPALREHIDLEAEAVAILQWQTDLMPGLLQTYSYASRVHEAYRALVTPAMPPGKVDRFAQARMRRQERLGQEPALQLSVVLDEAVLLRNIGDRDVMRAQLEHLLRAAELPNIDLRVMPLSQETGLRTGSFVIMGFGPRSIEGAASLGDVVSTESLSTQLYVEGEGEPNTYQYRLVFEALSEVSLPQAESRDRIVTIMRSVW